MKTKITVTVFAAALCSACVAGPGGSNNAANRTITGVAAGALLGGVVGRAAGADVITGVAVGALAGGALGAAVNPQHVFRSDTRGYCYMVDAQGRPVYDTEGQLVYDYTRRC
jgi:uncharacterized protein YcfJ